MTIKATCPACQTTFNYYDHQAGQRVRCDHCSESLVVPGRGDRAQSAFQNARADEEDREARRPSEPTKSRSSMLGWILLGVCLLVVALGLGGGAGFAWWMTRFVNNIQASVKNMVADLPGAVPEDEDEALAWIKQGGVRRQNAAQWIAASPVDPDRRAEVAAALEQALGDPNLLDAAAREALLSALAVWSGPENVLALVKSLDDDINDDVVDALIRLRDERGPKALAHQLESENYDEAVAALQRMYDQGVSVEDAVADVLLTTKDDTAKHEAMVLLGTVGTRRSLPKVEKAMREDNDLKDVGNKTIEAIKERN